MDAGAKDPKLAQALPCPDCHSTEHLTLFLRADDGYGVECDRCHESQVVGGRHRVVSLVGRGMSPSEAVEHWNAIVGHRAERGVVALEFLIIFPILIGMFFALFAFALTFVRYYIAQHYAAEIVRVKATELSARTSAKDSGDPTGRIEQQIATDKRDLEQLHCSETSGKDGGFDLGDTSGGSGPMTFVKYSIHCERDFFNDLYRAVGAKPLPPLTISVDEIYRLPPREVYWVIDR